MSEQQLVRVADKPALATTVAGRVLDRIATATGAVHVALTGGTSGIAVLDAIGADPRSAGIDWSRVHLWWGDERFVAADSADRNDAQAGPGFLQRIDIPAANVHRMAAADGPYDLDAGAEAYAAELAEFAEGGRAWPSFDIVLLGVGPDAHIASLFPGRGEVLVTDRAAVAVRDSPKPPPERISLTLPILSSAARVWLVLAGADKAEALAAALGDADPVAAPASAVFGREETVFFADEAAASRVP